ncbi:Lipopolysaccharide biosynthesis protein [uncultured Desulfobacterium sp.]|uniref:Lipopolysaccharide biosynthesis protein n=1 Tax=uncultured Desulfobacterium sp. TaxID=201089 RepID=A0A445MYM3_9BACT|nr:Lipopolysaccharide biosynthesis protein [uncultured Desulfobacterium sp.]
MNQTEPINPPVEYEDEINLLDLLMVIVKRKKMIACIVGCVFVLSIIISLLLTRMYTATATILPPSESNSSLSGLVSQTEGALGGLAGGLFGQTSNAELYVGMLKSRAVADMLNERFDLKKLWDREYLENIYDTLADQSRIETSAKTKIITISYEDKDPQMAADMANAYVEALDRLNRKLNITEGQRKREFLEKRLKDVKEDLKKSESELRQFQEKNKLITIDDQAKVTIEGAAKIKGEIIAAQTELEVLMQFGTERQNEAVMLKSKIEELQKQLARIETGDKDDTQNNLFIPVRELPSLGMELADRIREAKVQEKVFELITSQYELAKIEEAKDVNTIQVLDKAVPPELRSSPKRALIVLLSSFTAFFMAVFLAFFLEFVERLKTEDPERYLQIKNGLISDDKLDELKAFFRRLPVKKQK